MADLAAVNQAFESALLALDRVRAEAVLGEAVADHAAVELVEGVVAPALDRIGAGWDEGQVALSDIYMASRLCEEVVERLLPEAQAGAAAEAGPPVAVALLEDFHMLGEHIVFSVLRSAGIPVVDYGRVTVEQLVDRVEEDGISILLVSALMLRAALRVKALRQALDERGLAVTLVVGGAPFRFDPELWKQVGADAMGTQAMDAITIVRGLRKGQRGARS